PAQARVTAPLVEPVEPASATGAMTAEERVQQILAALPLRYSEVLTCRFLRNYSLKETAAHMNLSEANIKVLQFRALKKASQIAQNMQDIGFTQSQQAGLSQGESRQ
ncbi:MAG TPA: sigma factor-like helix-turn-helix DNA-binding protein, partial [Ktedonobacterales bacterium]|nr:sigma factor-like helix-turn-helix DNA-binding protein [Ktedonobacterales bacterium]